MLLRSVTKHVRDQNWFAVGVDFIIVVVGVFIGLQVANWNDTRTNERTYQNAMMRLAEESFSSLGDLGEFRPAVEERLTRVQAAILVLETCETDISSEATLNDGLNTIRGSSSPQAATLALDQLVNDDRLLARQSTTMRTTLRDYHAQLHNMNDVARFVSNTLSPPENDRHPLIGFTGILDPSESFNGTDIRRALINAPLEIVCKDNSFAKQFYEWERAQVYQLALSRRMEQIITDTLNTLEMTPAGPSDLETPK